jgi:L-alanine-DL-glutamate epimerase-like enolase superfamily enzyme
VFYCIRDYFDPKVIGLDPFDREQIANALNWRDNSCARAGIDLALLDLMGKAAGRAVGALIGGIHHPRLPVSKEIGGNPEVDSDRLRAMREAIGPQASLRADANQGTAPRRTRSASAITAKPQ